MLVSHLAAAAWISRAIRLAFSPCASKRRYPNLVGNLWLSAGGENLSPWRSFTKRLSNTIALLDLHGAVVDGGEHLGRVARHDDVDDGWAIALFHTLPKGGASASGSSTRMPPQPIARAIAA